MNVNKVLTKDYGKRTLCQRGKNEPKTNPNEPKSKPISEKPKMNVTIVLTKSYEKRTMNNELINTNPTCRGVASGEVGSNQISEAKNDAAYDVQPMQQGPPKFAL